MQKNEEPVNNKGKKDDKDTINGGMLMKAKNFAVRRRERQRQGPY